MEEFLNSSPHLELIFPHTTSPIASRTNHPKKQLPILLLQYTHDSLLLKEQ